jgi:membrane AbrB-like protein
MRRLLPGRSLRPDAMMDMVFRTLIIGTLGGALFHLVGVPAPWLAGSLCAIVAALYAGQKLVLPDGLRTAAFILLGIQTGTSVTPETLARAGQWPLSILGLAITVVVIVWACTIYYERVSRWDRATALFASLPGALSLVMLLAHAAKADMRRVTIAQCVRLFFLIAGLPALIKSLSPVASVAAVGQMGRVADVALLVIASGLAGLAFDRLRIPAGLILGATLVSAGLGLSGWVQGAAPDSILIPANIILGIMIGLRFTGISWRDLMRELNSGLAGFLIAMAISVVGAVVTSAVAGLPIALTLLAFAPGGLEAMTIMAFALNLDPAYVAAHQVARYIGMVLLMPGVTALMLRRRLGPANDVVPLDD